jgi:D-sedoheptulose 7-phosphate isomerase
MDLEKLLTATLQESIDTKRQFWNNQREAFFKASKLLTEAVQNGRKVLIFGNGGSACDALHFAGEWVNRFNFDRAPLPAMALTADGPLLTCIGNDSGFDLVFEKQVLGLGQKGDVAIGISTSGNSKNVLRGLDAAKKNGLSTLVLTGGEGGVAMKRASEWTVLLTANHTRSTPRIQECHEWILHSLSEVVELEIFKRDS